VQPEKIDTTNPTRFATFLESFSDVQDDTSSDHQASSAVDTINPGEVLLQTPPEVVHTSPQSTDAQPDDVLSENSHDQTDDYIQESISEGHQV